MGMRGCSCTSPAELAALPGHLRAERGSLLGVSLDSLARTSCSWWTGWSGASVLNRSLLPGEGFLGKSVSMKPSHAWYKHWEEMVTNSYSPLNAKRGF